MFIAAENYEMNRRRAKFVTEKINLQSSIGSSNLNEANDDENQNI